MAKRLPRDIQRIVLSLLLDGVSQRAITRATGADKRTVALLFKRAGHAARTYQDRHLRNLHLERVQLDEIWSFVYAKEKKLSTAKRPPRGAGDVWTWIALCPDTKLVPAWRVGDRSQDTAIAFVKDLESRLDHRVQLTTDGYQPYIEAVREGFGDDGIDYAMLTKVCAAEDVEQNKLIIYGDPQEEHVSTSLVERQNLTVRMGQRRFTRKTNAFSKSFQHHAMAVDLHFLYYNFIRIHESLRITPAMAAGVTDHLYDLDWLLDMIDEAWPKPNRPKTYKKRY